MEGLNELERAVLAKLLDGDDPLLASLRSQATKARVASREYTGVGFFCTFEMPADVPPLTAQSDFQFGDVEARMNGLKHGAGFVLFVTGGRLDMLEGYTYDEPWPAVIGDFELRYHSDPRDLRLPKR